MPRKLRTAKKIKRQPLFALLPGDSEQLESLLADVKPVGAVDAPPSLALLEFWQSLKVPWDATPTVPCYRCKSGEWLTGGVVAVVAALQRHAASGR